MYDSTEHEARITELTRDTMTLWPVRYHEESSESSTRAATIAYYYLAVERVIQKVRDDLSHSFTLDELAEIAAVSPYHFNRIFRYITGTPPLRFVYALRLAEAKRLLLQTRMNITDICFEVGYNSLGTFSSRFKELVGVTPTSLRRLVGSTTMPLTERFRRDSRASSRLPWQQSQVTGQVKAADLCAGPIFIGVFDTPIPQDAPVACTVLTAPGQYTIHNVPDGEYYLFAIAPRWSDNPIDYALLSDYQIRVGAGSTPVVVRNRRAQKPVHINLRRMRLIDPPILVDLLSLLVKEGYISPEDEHARPSAHRESATGI